MYAKRNINGVIMIAIIVVVVVVVAIIHVPNTCVLRIIIIIIIMLLRRNTLKKSIPLPVRVGPLGVSTRPTNRTWRRTTFSAIKNSCGPSQGWPYILSYRRVGTNEL